MNSICKEKVMVAQLKSQKVKMNIPQEETIPVAQALKRATLHQQI